MREEACIQSACLKIDVATNQQGSASGPGHRGNRVVLAFVAFHRTEDASSAEREAQPVDVAAACPCILQHVGRPFAAYLGLAGGHFWVRLHVIEHRPQPACFHADIAVEQQAEVALHLSDGFVVAFGKAVVAVEDKCADAGKLLGHQFERAIAAAIVGHDNLRLGRVLDDGRQEATQHLFAVPIQYDDGQLHANS